MRSAKRAGIGVAVLCLVAAAASVVGGAGAAAATLTVTHGFEPVRSLTGDSRTSKLDEVPDPGCPNGPNPPGGAFYYPTAVKTDPSGDIYVATVKQPGEG